MLTIKVREDSANPSAVMEVSLRPNEDNSVTVVATDSDGYEWSLAEISIKGMWLIPHISDRTGWPLDPDGRIKIDHR